MGAFFFQSKPGGTTQSYLGTVKLCEMCKSQRPKEQFRMVDGIEMCGDCALEEEEENGAS